ncbi:hypothetical protein NCCP691_13970 [Noviherbaspirillum aridicola]|uniref:Uncharacterized protein n=1 Tax=Noviherbaspirillum aridicola TaxID=2849687 RepID=A0ABQ4Q2G6_9BURK|nr:hypothetical protein NCCP691_13970 [Noviherbaspirillum aridicola]
MLSRGGNRNVPPGALSDRHNRFKEASVQVSELELLDVRLHQLRDRLRSEPHGERMLGMDDPLVKAALACEFMLPEQLTVRNLADTVERKIGNVQLLLERARSHEQLPESAQIASGQEYMAGSQEYRAEHAQPRR